MADGLTLKDLEEIKADAARATLRRFKEAAEDHGWEPTPTPELDNGTARLGEDSDLSHVVGEFSTGAEDLSISELRAQAKELGVSGAGSKVELKARIEDAQKGNE